MLVRCSLLCAGLVATQVLGALVLTPAAPVVDLGYAQYQGVPNAKTGNIDFLGIRYAAPPIGTGRFGEPRAPAKVNGIQLANSQPNMCRQGSLGLVSRSPFRGNATFADVTLQPTSPTPGVPPESEDCLFLNVVIPGAKVAPGPKLPVVVWIHGGGYMSGSVSFTDFGPAAFYDGNDLVALSDGKTIVVLIQYRLGLFGFLAGDEVKKGGALNAGILDQQYALKWVQRHISKFGGDPGRVTIWGESAGAGSVLQHIVANGGRTVPSLFQTAILSSSYLPPQYRYNEKVPEAVYTETAKLAGCGSAAHELECLRDVNTSLLAQVNVAISQNVFYGTFAFGPVVDGSFIRERPLSALQKGNLNSENVLAVTNSREGTLFSPPAEVLAAWGLGITDYIAELFPTFPQDRLGAVSRVYNDLGSVANRADLVMGESIFVCPTYSLLRSLGGRGYKAGFAVPPATHGSDIAYYFPSTGAPGFNNSRFKNTFGGAFLDFASYQNPNVNRPRSLLPRWSTWSGGDAKEVVFNRTGESPAITIGPTSSALLKRCQFWDSVGDLTSQ